MVLGRCVGNNDLSLDKTQTHYVNRVRRVSWRRIGDVVIMENYLFYVIRVGDLRVLVLILQTGPVVVQL